MSNIISDPLQPRINQRRACTLLSQSVSSHRPVSVDTRRRPICLQRRHPRSIFCDFANQRCDMQLYVPLCSARNTGRSAAGDGSEDETESAKSIGVRSAIVLSCKKSENRTLKSHNSPSIHFLPSDVIIKTRQITSNLSNLHCHMHLQLSTVSTTGEPGRTSTATKRRTQRCTSPVVHFGRSHNFSPPETADSGAVSVASSNIEYRLRPRLLADYSLTWDPRRSHLRHAPRQSNAGYKRESCGVLVCTMEYYNHGYSERRARPGEQCCQAG